MFHYKLQVDKVSSMASSEQGIACDCIDESMFLLEDQLAPPRLIEFALVLSGTAIRIPMMQVFLFIAGVPSIT